MAVIMVDVPEAAGRLDEMVDEVLAGEEVIITREGRPVGMLVPYEGRGRTDGEARAFGGRGGFADPLGEHGAPSGVDREVIIVRRRVSIVACML